MTGTMAAHTTADSAQTITQTTSVNTTTRGVEEMSLKKMNEDKTGFSDLAPELRNDIYAMLLTSASPITIYSGWERNGDCKTTYIRTQERLAGFTVNILLVSKAIHEETAALVYGSNTFAFRDNNAFTLFAGRTARISHRLRHLEIKALGSGFDMSLKLLRNAASLQSLTICIRPLDHDSEAMAHALLPFLAARKRSSEPDTDPMDIVRFHMQYTDDYGSQAAAEDRACLFTHRVRYWVRMSGLSGTT